MTPRRVEVAVVGGGPAGAITAWLLAASGHEVVVLERAPAWRWRACGVFTSPAAMAALRRVGLPDDTASAVARPIPAMRVETADGTTVRLTYGTERGGETAVSFDRATLDPALLELAHQAGAEVDRGHAVRSIEPASGQIDVARPDGIAATLVADVVVGADGLRSVVARDAGVRRGSPLGRRIGLTYHLSDPAGSALRDARMRIFEDGYVGIAPVPGGRVNVGIVLGRSWRQRLAERGAAAVAGQIVSAIPPAPDDRGEWRRGRPTDAIAGAVPLGLRVARRSGARWLLVGDAAGFLDPFTGEGLHRAIVSAELAAAAVHARARGRAGAFDAYGREMTRRFLAKDVVSVTVQGFLAQPGLFEYATRRLATRSGLRATMGLVMGDLEPATRVLDPRFLARLLAP